MKDELGDRMKTYEAIEKDKFIPLLPVYARMDGRGFSKYTKPLQRPFDSRMTQAMRATTARLVRDFKASIGFCQSDEISLIWLNDNQYSPNFIFGGIKQKLVSTLAGFTSASFYGETQYAGFPQMTRIPHFDARVMNLPNTMEAWNMLLWRLKDCRRNAISSTAYSEFGHSALQGVNTVEMTEMLEKKHGKPLEAIIAPENLNGIVAYRETYFKNFGGEALTRSRITSGYIENLPLQVSQMDFDTPDDRTIIDQEKLMALKYSELKKATVFKNRNGEEKEFPAGTPISIVINDRTDERGSYKEYAASINQQGFRKFELVRIGPIDRSTRKKVEPDANGSELFKSVRAKSKGKSNLNRTDFAKFYNDSKAELAAKEAEAEKQKDLEAEIARFKDMSDEDILSYLSRTDDEIKNTQNKSAFISQKNTTDQILTKRAPYYREAKRRGLK